MPAVDYDPLVNDTWDDPYPVYRELRDHAPVHWAERTGVYCVSRYEDVLSALRRPEVFSSARAFEILTQARMQKLSWRDAFPLARFLWRARVNPVRLRKNPPQMLITTDPPRHDALRSIVNRGFTPRRMEVWDARMRELVDRCIEPLRRGDPFDVIRDLAIPLPVTVIAEMLGIDPRGQADFKRWSDAVIAGASGSQRDAPFSHFLDSMGELRSFLRGEIARRRADPGDDLISILVDPTHGVPLDETDVAQFVFLLLVAGNETTTNLIGNATRALLAHREELERVRSDPALTEKVVEETLRYDGPIQYVFRRATRDVELAGTRIPAEARVALLLGSANRDERRFPEPDRFDLTRDTRGHLGFGFGVHFCLGASLARMEGRIALEALIPELPHRSPKTPNLHLVDSLLVRGLERLELVAT